MCESEKKESMSKKHMQQSLKPYSLIHVSSIFLQVFKNCGLQKAFDFYSQPSCVQTKRELRVLTCIIIYNVNINTAF
jgi:hypothetical protein